MGGGTSPGVFPRSPTCVDFSHVTDQGQATPDRLPSQRRLRRLGQFNAVHQVAAKLMPRVHRQRVLGGHNGLVAAAGKPLSFGQAIEDFHRRLVAAGGRRETFHAVVVAAQGRIGQPEQIEHLLRFLGRRVGVGEALQGLQGLLRLARLPIEFGHFQEDLLVVRYIAQRGRNRPWPAANCRWRMIRPCTAQTEGSFGFRWMAVSASVRAVAIRPMAKCISAKRTRRAALSGAERQASSNWVRRLARHRAATGFRHSRVVPWALVGQVRTALASSTSASGCWPRSKAATPCWKAGENWPANRRSGSPCPPDGSLCGQGQQGDCGKQRPYGRSRWHPASRRRKSAEHSLVMGGSFGCRNVSQLAIGHYPDLQLGLSELNFALDKAGRITKTRKHENRKCFISFVLSCFRDLPCFLLKTAFQF